MTTRTYTISAGCYESILRATGNLTGHASVQDALDALRAVCSPDDDDYALYDCDEDGALVYLSQESLDDDDTGSRAIATILRVQESPRVQASQEAFLAEVSRLGGTREGAAYWLEQAIEQGIEEHDTAESLAWSCVDDELCNLDPSDRDRIAALLSALLSAQEEV